MIKKHLLQGMIKDLMKMPMKKHGEELQPKAAHIEIMVGGKHPEGSPMEEAMESPEEESLEGDEMGDLAEMKKKSSMKKLHGLKG